MTKLKITTLVVGVDEEICGVYHSVKTSKKEIEKDLVEQVISSEDKWEDEELKCLSSLKGIAKYFEIYNLSTKTIEI